MKTRTRIPDVLERILDLSKADDCIAIGWEETDANIRWAGNTVTTNGTGHGSRLYVISVIGGRVGTVGRSFFPPDELPEIVRASEAACEGKPEAEDLMPLVSGDVAGSVWGEPHPETGIEALSPFVPQLSRSFDRARADGVELFGYAQHSNETVWLATSSGLRARYTRPDGFVELTAKTPDFQRSSWAGRATATFRDVEGDLLYDRVAQRLEWSKRRIELPAGRYEVLLESSAVADMLIYAYFMSTARDADEGRSVFSKPGGGNRIGERLYPEGVSLYSDPAEEGLETLPFLVALGSSSYFSLFDNGVSLSRTDWVTRGVLTELISTRYWAQKTGRERVTPFVYNLVFDAPTGPTMDELVSSTERALLVNCFWYIRVVDPRTLLLTGLTRDGVFLVEDGEVKGAVNNFRFNESPVDMLARAVEIGRAEPTLARELGEAFRFVRMPPLRVEGFNMSSVSEAT